MHSDRLARELVSQRIVVMLRSDRLRANGGLYRNDSGPYRDTCIHIIRGELVIVNE